MSNALLAPPKGITMSVHPAPRREPPFDDELADVSPIGPRDRRLPFLLAPQRPHASPQTEPALPLPEPGRWARSLLISVIETAAGRRPIQQLGALCSPPVATGLSRTFERAAMLRRPHWTRSAIVRSVHASSPRRGVAELSATMQDGRRIRAVAIRLEARDGRWRCTRLQLG